MSNYIHEIVNNKIDYLISSYKANKLVNHQGIKGNLNEILLREILQSVIPSKYKFTNGVIQDSKGFQSNESDLIIYDNEILPTILFGGELGFVPSESVKYNIEVKTTLTSAEVKSTIAKFQNVHNCIDYKGVNTLFAFSSDLTSKHELERYYESDKDSFFQNPHIKVLMIVGKGYYFFNAERIYLKDLISKNEFAQIANRESNGNFKIDNLTVDINSGADIDIKGDFIINGINYEEIYIHRFSWHCNDGALRENDSFLSFLSGVSNTLSQGTFGKYLMGDNGQDMKMLSECIVDMWGNPSHKKFDINGIEETILKKFTYSFSLNENGENNKIKIYPQN